MPFIVDISDNEEVKVLPSTEAPSATSKSTWFGQYQDLRYKTPVIDPKTVSSQVIDLTKDRRKRRRKNNEVIEEVPRKSTTQRAKPHLGSNAKTNVKSTERPSANLKNSLGQSVTREACPISQGGKPIDCYVDDAPGLFISPTPETQPVLNRSKNGTAPAMNTVPGLLANKSPAPASTVQHRRQLDGDSDAEDDFSVRRANNPANINGLTFQAEKSMQDTSQAQRRTKHKPHVTESGKKIQAIRRDVMDAAAGRSMLFATRSIPVAPDTTASSAEPSAKQQAPHPKRPLARSTAPMTRPTINALAANDKNHASLNCKPQETQESTRASEKAKQSTRKWTGYHCPLCDETYTQRSDVRRHFDICVRENGNPNDLDHNSHESWTALPYECALCKQSFARPETARSHAGCSQDKEKPHDEDRQRDESRPGLIYKCPFCHKSFNRRYLMVNHSQVCVHNEERVPKDIVSQQAAKGNTNEKSGDLKYKCPICEHGYQDLQHVERHFESCSQKHGNPEGKFWYSHESCLHHPKNKDAAFRCPTCNAAFTYIGTANMHVRKCARVHSAAQVPDHVKPVAIREISPPYRDHTSKKSENLLQANDKRLVNTAPGTINTTGSGEACRDEANTPSSKRTADSFEFDTAYDTNTSYEADHEDSVPSASSSFLKGNHPTEGGKSISAENLAEWECRVDEVETTELAYVYFVTIRSWPNDSEEGSQFTNLGPFHTLEEANATAKEEVKYPLDRLEVPQDNENVMRPGWAYTYSEDEHGMQSHKMAAAGLHSEAIVRREIPPTPNRQVLPVSAFKTPPIIYLVSTLVRFHTSETFAGSDTDELFNEEFAISKPPPDCEKSTLGAYTALDLANKRAGDFFLNLATQHMSNRGEEGVKKNEIKMAVRQEIADLDADGEMFQKTTDFEEDGGEEESEDGKGKEKQGEGSVGRKGVFALWVEKVSVEGPRN